MILQPLGVVAVLFAVALPVGRRLLNAGPERWGTALTIGLAATIGLALWILGSFALAVVGQLRPLGFLILACLFGALGWTSRRAVRTEVAALLRVIRPRRRREWLLAAWATTTLAAATLGALAPPHDPDGLGYHLPLARKFAEAGALVHVSALDSYTAAYPLGIEILFAALLQLGGETAPACLQLACGLTLLLMIAGLGARMGGREAGLVSFASMLASPILILLCSTTYIDLTFIALAVASLVLIDGGAAAPGGLLAGVAMGTKPGFGALPLLIGVVVIAVGVWRGEARPVSLMRFVGTALLSLANWPLWRWWSTGNPIYPLIWGGRDIDPAALPRLLQLMGLARYDLFDLLLGRIHIRDASDLALSNGPILLAFVPLVILLPSSWRRPGYCLATLISFAMVALLYARDRFLLLSLSYAAPLVGPVWVGLVSSGGWVRRTARATLLVGMTWGVIYAGKLELTHLAFVTGRETRAAYLERWFGDYPLVAEANRIVPSQEGVFRLCRLDCRSYYERYRVTTLESVVLRLGRIHKTAAELAEIMRQHRMTFIIDCGNLGQLFQNEQQARDFEDRLELVYHDGHRKRLLRWRGSERP